MLPWKQVLTLKLRIEVKDTIDMEDLTGKGGLYPEGLDFDGVASSDAAPFLVHRKNSRTLMYGSHEFSYEK